MSLIHQMLRDFEKIRHAPGHSLGEVGADGMVKVPVGMGSGSGRQKMLWLAAGMALATAFAVTPWIWQGHSGNTSRSAEPKIRQESSAGQREPQRFPGDGSLTGDSQSRSPNFDVDASEDADVSLESDTDFVSGDHDQESESAKAGKRLASGNATAPVNPVSGVARDPGKVFPAPFMVQLGVFFTTEEAIRFQAGLPAKVRESSRISPVRDFLNRPMFAVRSGPFGSREEAAAVSGMYDAQGVEGAFVAQAVEEVPLVQMDGKVSNPSVDVLPPVLSATPQSHATEVDPPATTGGENGKPFFLYAIQAGSFREGSAAESLAAKLRDKGQFPYILRLRGVDNALWHSVCFGLFTDMEVAKKALKQFKGGELGKAYVLPVESRSFIKFIARRNDGTVAPGVLDNETTPDNEKKRTNKTRSDKSREAKVAEAKVAEAKVAEAKVAEAKVEEAKVAEAKVTEAKAAEAKVTEAKVQETRNVASRARESMPRQSVAETTVAEPEVAEVSGVSGSGGDLSGKSRAAETNKSSGNLPAAGVGSRVVSQKNYIDEKDRYAIQVGAFMEDETARDLVRELRKRGYDPYILELPNGNTAGKMRKTVRIGSFHELRDAEKANIEFRKREKRDGYVVTIDSSHSPGDMSGKGEKLVLASKGGEEVLVKKGDGPVQVNKSDAAVDVLEDYSNKTGEAAMVAAEADPLLTDHAAPAGKPAKVSEKQTETGAGAEKPYPFLHKPKPLKDVIQKAGDGVSGKSMQSDKFYQEAQRLEQGGDLKGAEEFARRALDLNPVNQRAREFLARILFTSGRSNEAYPLLSEGLAKGFDAGLVKLFARILVQDGKTESALGVLENAQAQGGAEDEELMALLAAMYQRNKNHWKAIELYEKLLAKHTDNSIWWMGLAISLEGVEEKTSALQAYQNAMDNGQLKLNLKNFVGKRIQALSN
ncbi:MAG: SPOR domain-containing protein [Magnetococcus sp. DMHC-1]